MLDHPGEERRGEERTFRCSTDKAAIERRGEDAEAGFLVTYLTLSNK